jgi:hypothetical protein
MESKIVGRGREFLGSLKEMYSGESSRMTVMVILVERQQTEDNRQKTTVKSSRQQTWT